MAKHSHTVPILTQTDAHVFWKCSESAFPGLREGGREREEEGRGGREREERGRKGEGGERCNSYYIEYSGSYAAERLTWPSW